MIEAAHKAGIQYIASPTKIGARIDLSKTDDERAQGHFGNEVGFGQYAITALDHANGVATLANGGVYNKAHFVKSVKTARRRRPASSSRSRTSSSSPRKPSATDVVAAIDHVLQKIPSRTAEP